jgi:aspartokinase
MSNNPVTNINITYNVALVTVDNLPSNTKLISDILNTVAQRNINIDMICQTPSYRGTTNISFSIPSDDLVNTLSALNSFKKSIKDLQIEIDADNTKLQVYGEGMRSIPGVAARLFTILANEGIEIKLVTTSEIDISYLIYDKDVDKAIQAIKSEYNLE